MKDFNEENTKRKNDFPPGYGVFPYIMIKAGYARYIQLPIQRNPMVQMPNKGCVFISEKVDVDPVLSRKHNLDALMQVRKQHFEKHKTYLPMCLVEGPEDVVYVSEQGEIMNNSSIPKGGVLLTGSHNIISLYGPHYYTHYV